MKEKRIAKNMVISGVLCATAIVGCSFLFNGATNVVRDNEINKPPVVVNYPNVIDMGDTNGVVPLSTDSKIPEGYVKANYKVELRPPFGSNVLDEPTAKDMSMEDAAEIGAQAIWSIFGIDLKDTKINMTYDAVGVMSPTRATWTASVDPISSSNNKSEYWVRLDAITGELYHVGDTRTLGTSPNIGRDDALVTKADEYVTLAKEVVAKHNLIEGETELVHVGHGLTQNTDPYITIELIAEDGEECHVKFSRYDQKLLGITYDVCIKSYKVSSELSDATNDRMTKIAMDEYGDKKNNDEVLGIISGGRNDENGNYVMTFNRRTSTNGIDRITVYEDGTFERVNKIVVEGVTYTDYDKADAAERALDEKEYQKDLADYNNKTA